MVLPMEISDDDQSDESQFEEDDVESDSEYDSDDSDYDPSFDVVKDTEAKLSNLSIKKKSKSRIKDLNGDREEHEKEGKGVVVEADERDEKSLEAVQALIEAGKLETLKVDQCKVYLRKNGLRLTGNKETLVQRIKEHREILDGQGERKYPVSSFVLYCKGDACIGDVVMFEQNVYDLFSIVSRSATGPPGKRIVAGRIVKESYGAAKQQHTFTIEVLWSRGEKPLPPLYPLLIKGRNLYRFNTMRQRWEDEVKRKEVLMEKHSRGFLARSDKEARIQEKERRKKLKENRKKELKTNQARPGTKLKKAKPGRGASKEEPSTSQLVFSDNSEMMKYNHQPSNCIVSVGKLSSYPLNGAREYAFQHPHNISSSLGFHPRNEASSLEKYLNAYAPKDVTQNSYQEILTHGSSFNNNQCGYASNRSSSHMARDRQPLVSVNWSTRKSMGVSQARLEWQVCRYYHQGRCKFGDNCKFLHDSRRK